MRIEKTIIGLLNKVSTDYKHLSWKLICTYSDGQTENIYELTIAKNLPPYQKSHIIFRLHDGFVLNCNYPLIQQHSGQNIIDLLLDIINLENIAILRKVSKPSPN